MRVRVMKRHVGGQFAAMTADGRDIDLPRGTRVILLGVDRSSVTDYRGSVMETLACILFTPAGLVTVHLRLSTNVECLFI